MIGLAACPRCYFGECDYEGVSIRALLCPCRPRIEGPFSHRRAGGGDRIRRSCVR